jgi:phosphoribosyl 1,2-cyclic phosphodiesterase
LLETEHTTLLVDAGLGRREITRRFEALGRLLPDRVDAVLVTHEHTDHSNAAAQLARLWDCPAYLTEPTHREIVRMFTEDPEKPSKKATFERVEYFREGTSFEIGDIIIHPFHVPHDAKDPVGFTFRTNGTKVAIVTDLGRLTLPIKQHLRETDFLILESNHDLETLKCGSYPWHIKMRIMGDHGHLSNKTVSDYLVDSDEFDAQARHLVLAHLSEENNNPNVAEISAKEALDRRPSDFAFRGSLHIASQRIPIGPFEL